MQGSGRFATFVETHVKPWQVVVGLAVGVVTLVTALIAGTTAVMGHFSSHEDPPPPLASVVGDQSATTWGPSRRVFEEAERPEIPVLNSVSNNPSYGDERNFVLAREADGEWSDSVDLHPGETYDVSIYIRNDATEFDSRHTYVRAMAPAVVESGSAEKYAAAFASSSTSLPSEVWDNVKFTNSSDSTVALRYVPDSATVSIDDLDAEKVSDSDSLFGTEGVAVGTPSDDGIPTLTPGSSAIITYSFVADWPSFAYSSVVRVDGSQRWQHDINAQPGDRIQLRLAYANDGTTDQNDVVLRNVLPREMVYIDGSSRLQNSSNPDALAIGDGINAGGVNIGSYSANSNAFLYLEAEVSSSACGELNIDSSAETTNGNKRDRNILTVAKPC